MQIGMVGLGKMGANMTTRLLRGGHEVVVFDRSAESVAAAAKGGAAAATSLADLVSRLASPRAVWVMVPIPPRPRYRRSPACSRAATP